MRSQAAGVFVAFVLIGCSSAPKPEPVWTKPGASEADYQRDMFYCEEHASNMAANLAPTTGDAFWISVFKGNDWRRQCMQGLGWTLGG